MSTVLMYGLMFLNVEQVGHVRASETRAFMALIMGATMAALMPVAMAHMFRDPRRNRLVWVMSAAVFALALWLVRSQAIVGDVGYMKGMIPHHSIAILTSERAQIHDPRVRALADRIIAAQRREIGEMDSLIRELEASR